MDFLRKIFLVSLFLMPFFQGLYFYHEVFITMLLLLGLLLASGILQKGFYLEKSFTLLFLIGLFVLYLITCLYAIDKGMAFVGALKVLLYGIFYLVYLQLYSEELREKAFTTIIYSCIAAGILGILAFFLPFLADLMIQKQRLGGVFQYANTYGLFCIVGLLLMIRRKEKTFFEIWAMAIMTIATILTFSRSILIIGVVVVILGILYERKHLIQHLTGIFTGSVIGFTLVKVLNLGLVGSRLADTSMQTSEWVTRLVYYKDALNIIAKFPFGTGYMGYSYIEKAYQTSSTYQVKFVHSNLLQYALDIGIIGALLCCSFLVLQLFSKKMDLILKLVMVTIAFHGLIDFDFEFPIILIILLITIGVKQEVLKFKAFLKVPVVILAGLVLVYGYMAVTTYLAYDGQVAKAYTLYPGFTEAKLKELSHYKNYSLEQKLFAEALTNHNQYAVEAFAYQRDYYFHIKDFVKAQEFGEKCIELNPLNLKHVEIYSNILIECIEEAIKEEDYGLARQDLELILLIPDYLEKLAKERLSDYNIRHVPNLVMTDLLLTNDKKANQLRLEIDKD